MIYNWCDGEGASAVDGRDAVLLQRAGTPAVDAAHAAVFTIESKNCKWRLGQLRGMALVFLIALIEQGNVIVQRTGIEGFVGGYFDANS